MFGFTDAVRTNLCTASATNRMVEEKMKSWLLCQERDRDGGRKRRFFRQPLNSRQKEYNWICRLTMTIYSNHDSLPLSNAE